MMINRRVLAGWLLVLMAMGAQTWSGCAERGVDRNSSGQGPGQATARQEAGRMTETDIFGLLEAANQADLHAGQVAQRLASDPQVRNYGRRMETDHDMLLKKGRETATALKIPPGLGKAGQRFLREHTDDMAQLQTQTGPRFDQQYIQHEIEMHQKLLQQVDQASQQAQRPEVKKLLESVRPALQDHLRAAQTLQQRVGADGQRRKAS